MALLEIPLKSLFFNSVSKKALCYLFIVCFSAISHAREDITKLPIGNELGLYLEYHIDEGKALTIDHILSQETTSSKINWQSAHEKTPNFGISPNTFWFRLKLTNNSDHTANRIIEVANPRITSIDLYHVRWNEENLQMLGVYKSGLSVPFNKRETPSRNLTHKISIEPGEKIDLYFKMNNVFGSNFPLFVWTDDSLSKAESKRAAFQGLYFGIIIVLIIYNLFVYLMVRETSYIWYGVFMSTVSFFMLIDKGYAYQLLWPSSAYLEERIYSLTFSMTAITGVLFAVSFLHLKQNLPFYYRLHIYMAIWWLLLIPFNFILDFKWFIVLAFISVFPSTFISFSAALAASRKGDWGAKYYTASWLVLTGGSFYYTLAVSGFAQINVFSTYCFQVANLGEALLLSFGLAYRIKLLHLEKARARASEKAKSEFLANMSHEIRTPMNGVVGMAQLLQSTPMNSQQQNYLKVVVDSGNALLNILNDILDYSKIESGKMEIEKLEFPLYELLSSTCSVFSLQATNSSIRYHLWISPNTPETIVGDPNRLRQVLTNFLSNAFKFTSHGFIKVRCTYREKNEIGSLRIAVHDTGIGIKPAHLNKLFEGFSQADTSISRRFGGTGLGLTISKTLVELMDGQITVESEEGKGSCFWLEIPTSSLDAPIKITDKANKSVNNHIKNRNVILISSDAILKNAFTEFQQTFNFQYKNYPSVESCLEDTKSKFHSVDGIVIDMLDNPLAYEKPLQKLLDTINKQPHEQLTITLFVPPGFDSQAYSQYDFVEDFEAPCCINGYFSHLLKPHCSPSTKVQSNKSNFNHISTLVIEDNKVNQMVVHGLLSKLGIHPSIASSAEEGLAWLQKNRQPNLILMDCSLPGIDGYEATRIIRNKYGNAINIVALSANALEDHRELCVECGMNEQLSKPLKLDALEAVLHKLFSLKSTGS